MAKDYSELQSIMKILKEVFKLPCRSKKVYLFIVISTMISYSILFLAQIFYILPLSQSLYIKLFSLRATGPKTPGYFKQFYKIKNDFTLLFSIDMIFLFLMFVVSLFSMVATIYVSAMSYLGRDLTVMNLYLKIKKIWFRPLVTLLYISLLHAGYFIWFLPICFLVNFGRGPLAIPGPSLLVLASYLGMYLYFVWMLSLVTSVLEDCYGLEALGKAEKLVKGRKIVGLSLTFVFVLLTGAIVLVYYYATKNHETVMIRFLSMYVMLNLGILMKIVSMMVYTVFYFDRKQSQGEPVEVGEDMGYGRLPKIPLVASALP